MTFIQEVRDFFDMIGKETKESWAESLPILSVIVAVVVFIILLLINWKFALGFFVGIILIVVGLAITIVVWMWVKSIQGAIDAYNEKVKKD